MKDFLHIKVFKYQNGQYAGMDHASGGYPYPTTLLFQAHRWENRPEDEVDSYARSFPELILHYLKITVEDEL